MVFGNRRTLLRKGGQEALTAHMLLEKKNPGLSTGVRASKRVQILEAEVHTGFDGVEAKFLRDGTAR